MSSDQTTGLASEEEQDIKQWKQEYQDFIHGRTQQVRTAAQTWLTVMTSLLGLFSAAIVVNGGTAISDLPASTFWRALVFLLAVAVYGVALLALVLGALVTFGGLGVPRPQRVGEVVHRESRLTQWRNIWWPTPASGTWQDYRRYQVERADRLRINLHRSRVLGIGAVLLAGLLALVVLGISGFVHDSPGAMSVVVVHDGKVTCGPITVDDGQTRVGGQEISQATQVVVVAHC